MSLIAVALLALTAVGLRLRGSLPSVAQIASFQPISATTIWSADGVLLAKLQIENRKPVPLREVSPRLIDATLAVEDSRFFQHTGIDLRGIARAIYANLAAKDMQGQGASTITQQLARNVSQFGITREKSLSRKLREAMTAVRIEQVFDKETILELYLNQIYYGSGAYGIEAAARTYFNKPASKLDLAEAALLAGLPQRPVAYSPYSNPKRALERRNVVLKRMLDTGRISIGDYDRARTQPVRLAKRSTNHSVYRAPYFVDWVVQDLVKRYSVDSVYNGWKVVTTLDWRMQERAERALRRGLGYGATQGALVAIDPHSGEVRAMVGGVDYQKDRFNAVTQGKRQPGSAFKPIVYAAAFDSGSLSLYSELKDEPLEIPSERKVWKVRNFGGGYRNQDVTVLDAITSSINTIAVQAAQETGIPRIIYTAQRMGITTDLAPYLPLALGASAVRPIDLCAAYGTFAAEGYRYRPAGIRTIQDSSGRTLYQDSPSNRRDGPAISSGTVEQINVALRSVVERGTGHAANGVPNAFGKTGTTNDGRDAWFVGYTPELVTAVWVAKPWKDKNGITRYAVMPGATGGRVAAPLWAEFMSGAVTVQKQANRLRRLPQYAIALPPPPPKEKTITLDGDRSYGDDVGHADSNVAYFTNSDASEGHTDGDAWVERETAAFQSVATYEPSGQGDRGSARLSGVSSVQDLSGGGRTVSYGGGGSMRNSPVESRIVRICADTGRLATEWCDATILIDSSTRITPSAYCRRHHAPFGEPQR